MSTPPRIHLPGAPVGAPDPQSPTLISCSDCGAMCMVPFVLVEQAAARHNAGCTGPRLALIEKALTRLLTTHAPMSPEVQS